MAGVSFSWIGPGTSHWPTLVPFSITFLAMSGRECHRLLRLMALGHLVMFGGGLTAQQEGRPVAAGASFPTRESLLTIATETPFVPPRRLQLPQQVDLSTWFPKAGDQGYRNSCTGWAVGYALRSYQEKRRQQPTTGSDTLRNGCVFSPSFVYNCAKQYLNKGDCDDGSDLVVAITVAVDNGVCRWNTLPYDSALNACKQAIPGSAFAEAVEHRMRDPLGLELHNTDQWKHHLLAGRPILIAMSIDEKLYDLGWDANRSGKDLIWSGPDTLVPDYRIYGHALVVGGYDDADSTFRVFNSWGTDWGRDGWFRVPYRVMNRTKWCYGAYVIDEVPPSEVPRVPCSAADDRTEAGHKLKDRLREGEFEEFEGLRLNCHDISEDAQHVTVEVECAEDPDGIKRTITFRHGQPVNFHVLESRWTFMYRRPFSLRSKAKRRAHFVLLKKEPAEDPHIDDVLERVKYCNRY